MGWVEKMNTEFKKQKMSSESEITPMITKQGLRFLQCYKSFSNRMDPHLWSSLLHSPYSRRNIELVPAISKDWSAIETQTSK